jgi:hypothetical protein
VPDFEKSPPVLLEKVTAEPNITLLLNTAVLAAEKSGAETIRLIRAFCAQNSTLYELQAPLFCDASGDGILGYLDGKTFTSRPDFAGLRDVPVHLPTNI